MLFGNISMLCFPKDGFEALQDWLLEGVKRAFRNVQFFSLQIKTNFQCIAGWLRTTASRCCPKCLLPWNRTDRVKIHLIQPLRLEWQTSWGSPDQVSYCTISSFRRGGFFPFSLIKIDCACFHSDKRCSEKHCLETYTSFCTAVLWWYFLKLSSNNSKMPGLLTVRGIKQNWIKIERYHIWFGSPISQNQRNLDNYTQ